MTADEAIAAFIRRQRTSTADELLDDLLDWQRRHDEQRADLCARCAMRTVDPTSQFGWCASCTNDRQIELDAAAERERARKQRWWDQHGNDWRAKRRGEHEADADPGIRGNGTTARPRRTAAR